MTRALLGKSTALLLTALAGIAATSKADDFSLKPKPKSGDTAEYTVSAEFQADQGAIKFNEKMIQKITAVNADGSFVKTIASNGITIDIGGQVITPNDNSITEVFLANGHVKTITADAAVDAASYRIANLEAFQAPDTPVKVGDEIKFDIPADKTLGTPAATADYKVVGTEKVKDWDTVKLTYTSAETEGETKSSMSGSLWLNAADGSAVKSDGKWKDVQPPQSPFPLTGTYKVERTK